jgi:hypothetical protein
MSIGQRVDYAANDTRPLPERAVASWFASGIEQGREHRVGRGDLPALMSAFRRLGVPDDLITATRIAAMRTREPIVLMTPLLWLTASATGDHRIVDYPAPPVTLIGDVPSYVFDKHTAVGKAAIHRFARENHAVRDVLTHLQQFEILTYCFTSTFRAGKATWHYNTVNVRISNLCVDRPLIMRRDDRSRASAAAFRGREVPESGGKSLRPRKEMLRLPTRHPHKLVVMD